MNDDWYKLGSKLCPHCYCEVGGSDVYCQWCHKLILNPQQYTYPIVTEIKKSPLDIQVKGDHYKKYKIQPVEFCQVNNVPYCESNVIKYIMRHKDKNGLEDLKKAKHYIELLVKLEYGETI